MSDYTNSTQKINEIIHNNSTTTLPEWALNFYFGILALGALLNLTFALVLSRCKRSGGLSLILQLSLTDLFSFYVSIMEISSINQRNWPYSSVSCQIFKGTEILVNSLTIYLIVCYNFHIVTLWNLYEGEIGKNSKNPLTSGGGDDDSNECLVTKQENSQNRIVNIDYRRRKNDISVIFPIVLVWFVCLSLSIPNFTLSSTLKFNQNFTLCAVISVYYSNILHNLSILFKVCIPVILLIISLLVSIYKLSKNSNKDIEKVLTKKFEEVRKLMIFVVILTIFYLLTSLQRLLLHFLHVQSHNFNVTIDDYKMPPLYNKFLNNSSDLYLAMLHYSGGLFRTILYLIALPKFRNLIRSRIFLCCNVKK